MGSNRNPPLVLQGGLLYHHRRNSPMVKAWLHAGGVIFLRKLGSTATAKVLRLEDSLGQDVWRGLPQPTADVAARNTVPPSSELSDGEGVSVRWEGDVPAGVGKYSSSQSPTTGAWSRAGSLVEDCRNPSLAQQRGMLCHHRRNSPMAKAWLMFLRKLGSTVAVKVVRWGYSHGYHRRVERQGAF